MASEQDKTAPVQGYAGRIPWEMHLRAYERYCLKWSPQQALIEGGCRGGFHAAELDEFIPGWREELSEIAKLATERDRLRLELIAIYEFAMAHHGDQEPHVWLHGLTVDIPDQIERALEHPASSAGETAGG